MIYISLHNKMIEMKVGEEKFKYTPDDAGVRALWKKLEELDNFSIMYSSSVDFPEDAGLSEDFNLDAMLSKMQSEKVEDAIQEILQKIDRLVEEGNIQELAKCSKRFVLMHFGRDSDEEKV